MAQADKPNKSQKVHKNFVSLLMLCGLRINIIRKASEAGYSTYVKYVNNVGFFDDTADTSW